MNHQLLFSTIIKSAYTRADARRRLRLLKEYLEKIFYSQNSILTLTDYLKTNKVSEYDLKVMSLWDPASYNWLNPENIYDVLNTISKDINRIPNIILYIAKPVDDAEKEKIGMWFKKYIAPDKMLEFQNDQDKVGGCAVVNKGVYSDFSLKYFLKKERQNILNLIDSYAADRTNTNQTK